MRADPPTPDQKKFIESYGLTVLKTFNECRALIEFILEGNNDETINLKPEERAELYRKERERLLDKEVVFRGCICTVSFVGPRLRARFFEGDRGKIPTFFARLKRQNKEYATVQPSTNELNPAA